MAQITINEAPGVA